MDLVLERTLIKRIKKGDKDSFKSLYQNYANMMYIFCSRKIRNEEYAHDLVQEVFIRLWKNRKSLDESQKTKPLLYKIASNLCIDHLRKNITLSNNITFDNQQDGISYQSEGFDVSDRINEEIGKLTTQQREVFCLSKYENLKYSEISETLEISVKTVENHMGRALKKLRENLSDLLVILISFYFGVQK